MSNKGEQKEDPKWTTSVIVSLKIKQTGSWNRHLGPKHFFHSFLTPFRTCIRISESRVLKSPIISSIFPESGFPKLNRFRSEKIHLSYYIHYQNEKCLLILTDFKNQICNENHELWNASDFGNINISPTVLLRDKESVRSLGLCLERGLRFARLVKCLWSVTPHNTNLLRANQKPSSLLAGVHVGPVAWLGSENELKSGNGEIKPTDKVPYGSELIYAEQVRDLSSGCDFAYAAVSNRTYQAFRTLEISGAAFEESPITEDIDIKRDETIWKLSGVRAMPIMDSIRIQDAYRIWSSVKNPTSAPKSPATEYVNPFWGPYGIDERANKLRKEILQKAKKADIKNIKTPHPADYYRKFIHDVADGGNIRNWLAVELATQALLHGSPNRALALLETSQLVGREITATCLVADLYLHSSIDAASKCQAAPKRWPNKEKAAEKQQAYEIKSNISYQRSHDILTEIENIQHTSPQPKGYSSGLRVDSKVFHYVNTAFKIRGPVGNHYWFSTGESSLLSTSQIVIKTFKDEVQKGYSHGRAWLWSLLFKALERKLKHHAENRSPCLIRFGKSSWCIPGDKPKTTVEIDVSSTKTWTEAIEDVDAETNVKLETALQQINDVFLRVHNPSARMFHLLSWMCVFAGPIGDAFMLNMKATKNPRNASLGLAIQKKMFDELEREWKRLVGEFSQFGILDDDSDWLKLSFNLNKDEWNRWAQRVSPWILVAHPLLLGVPISADGVDCFEPFDDQNDQSKHLRARCWVAPIQLLPLHVASKTFDKIKEQADLKFIKTSELSLQVGGLLESQFDILIARLEGQIDLDRSLLPGSSSAMATKALKLLELMKGNEQIIEEELKRVLNYKEGE